MSHDFPYIENRLEGQKNWHSDKATWNKNRYYATEIITLTTGAIIPIINVLDVMPATLLRGVSAVLAAIIVVASGIAKLCKFQENWLNFRAVAEALEREKELYEHGIGAYALEQNRRDRLLVERVENMLASTTAQFISMHSAERELSQAQSTPNQPKPGP